MDHMDNSADVIRCFGNGDPQMEEYHDTEWGVPVRDDQALLERLALEAFQSGLSWSTVLHKRAAFNAAFADFDPRVLAGFEEEDVLRLLEDAGIIRNRRKIEATITNARALVALQESGGSLSDLIWSHAPENPRPAPVRGWDDMRSESEESKALAKDLKANGFVFVGPVTMYALMQACGLVDDHLEDCVVRTG